MSKTITITGVEPETFCAICGRPLKIGVVTAELGTIGADCLVRGSVPDKKRFNGNGLPTPSWIRELAKIAENGSAERRGLSHHHFSFRVKIAG
jgi:hypothetical protein